MEQKQTAPLLNISCNKANILRKSSQKLTQKTTQIRNVNNQKKIQLILSASHLQIQSLV